MGRKEVSPTETEALLGILDFLIGARKNTYASGHDPKRSRTMPGAYEFHYSEGTLRYKDVYRTGREGAGGFAGIETVDQLSRRERKVVLTYAYAGGLTRRGVLYYGEEFVWDPLRFFLRVHVDKVRLGLPVVDEGFDNKDGQWRYVGKGDGRRMPWGWQDEERITLNGRALYVFRGTAVLKDLPF